MFERVAHAVTAAPRIRAQPELAGRMDVFLNKLCVPLEAARRKDRWLGCRLAEANATRGANEYLRQSARVESLSDRARVPRLVLHHGRTNRLEPCDPVVELFPDDALQLFIAGRT